MGKIDHLFYHHFGGKGKDNYASTINYGIDVIEKAHRSRWPDFPSQLNGSYIGYNAVVWPDGTFTQHRYIGEETAAVKGFNRNGAHICIAGNRNTKNGKIIDPVSVEAMTTAILLGSNLLGFDVPEAFKLKKLNDVTIDIQGTNVLPHRARSFTQCYGDGWNDRYILDKILEYQGKRLKILTLLVMAYKDLLYTLKSPVFGADDREDPTNLPDM